jgi:DNA-binding LacI/PurR family transcriptional regulator
VVGFDDTPVAAYLTPGLTTVRLDWVALGRACFALLHSLVDPQATAAGVPPEPELIIRESTGGVSPGGRPSGAPRSPLRAERRQAAADG